MEKKQNALQRETVAPRISILDAGELDAAIFGILKSQTNYAVKYLPPWILNKCGLELDTLLKLFIWKFSIGKHKASFGQQLLHLKYSESTRDKNLQLLAFLTIGIPYLKEKILSRIEAEDEDSSRKVKILVDTVESTLQFMNVLTFVRFLWQGGPPTILELLLQLNPVSSVKQSKRNVGYSYMTRELIWHGFIELLVILLPLVNYHHFKRYFSRLLYGSKKKPVLTPKSIFTSETLCATCKQSPILPHQMGCSHYFCYLCLASNREADKMYECPSCGFSDPDPNSMKPVVSVGMPSVQKSSF